MGRLEAPAFPKALVQCECWDVLGLQGSKLEAWDLYIDMSYHVTIKGSDL